ncbi:MAG: lysophospholipid acyltransferase family protein [Burkholderiaceae bacterium]|jgi:Kdo2-lipid IVA lauroyltransferase/acyltransferase|nr:lysophospholipid acyltransferase family protein [Burkholderiaceae bacterium]
MNAVVLGLMLVLRFLPLPLLRGLGWVLGKLLWLTASKRRKVVLTNLALCFPEAGEKEQRRMGMAHMVLFAQAWLDRAWLWHGSPGLVASRLHMVGEVQALQQGKGAVIFAPHFVGLDAGWTSLCLLMQRRFTTIYTPQRSAAIDEWVLQGRQRFGQVRLFRREDGFKAIVSTLRQGDLLYLLPDMNFRLEESIFVPFYGVAAATVTTLPRLARLGQVPVVPVTTRLTPQGYEVRVHAAWTDYPGEDADADTALMNQRLQVWIDEMPTQYYWVHKRFKSRPNDEASLYPQGTD